MTTVLLVPGGLWEDGMDAGRFWRLTGIVAGLAGCGFAVLAPDRVVRATGWAAEANHLASVVSSAAGAGLPVVVVAGSNGCSAAVRLALDFPRLVASLLLAWPATAGDPGVDAAMRGHLAELGADDTVIDALLAGQTLRGVTDPELATVTVPVGVLPSSPPSPAHQRRTVDALLRLLPPAAELPGCPEPPRPEFPPQLDAFLRAVTAFANGSDGCD